ncbi:hypothetical protein DCC79_00190 [bacterium]|nr:MAG: hypothetical protein DCC79_00190 [bacterium]
MHKPAFTVAAAAAAIWLAGATSAQALAKVDQVRASLTEGASDAFPFPVGGTASIPSGSEKLYVTFDYTAAARDDIGVEMKSGGLLVFRSTKRYTGSGTATVEVTGLAVFQELTDQIADYADACQDNIDNARKSGNREYVQNTIGLVNSIRTALQIVDRAGLGGDFKTSRDSLDAALGKLEDLSNDLPGGANTDAIKALAAQMEPYVAQASEAAISLDKAGQSATAVALPDTGTDRGAAWTINVTVGGSPAYSGELWITSQAVAQPSATVASGATAVPGQATRTSAPAAGNAPTATPAPGATAAGGRNPSSDQGRTASSGSAATSAAGRATAPAGGAGTGFATLDQPSAPAAAIEPTVPSVSDAPTGGDEPAASTLEAPAPVATWTLPAGAAAAGDTRPAAPTDEDTPVAPGGAGPSLAVLGLGVMALMAIGLWLRRRM